MYTTTAVTAALAGGRPCGGAALESAPGPAVAARRNSRRRGRWDPPPPLEPLGPDPPASSGCPCRLRARVSIREVWLPKTTVRPRPSRSRPLGTWASRNSSRSNVRTARYACQFGRLASTLSAAWTPCAASSAAVDAWGLGVRRPPNTPASPTARHPRGELRRCVWRTRRPPPPSPQRSSESHRAPPTRAGPPPAMPPRPPSPPFRGPRRVAYARSGPARATSGRERRLSDVRGRHPRSAAVNRWGGSSPASS